MCNYHIELWGIDHQGGPEKPVHFAEAEDFPDTECLQEFPLSAGFDNIEFIATLRKAFEAAHQYARQYPQTAQWLQIYDCYCGGIQDSFALELCPGCDRPATLDMMRRCIACNWNGAEPQAPAKISNRKRRPVSGLTPGQEYDFQ